VRFRLSAIAPVVFVLCTVASNADACSCMGAGPPCQAAWAADTVFVGQVVSIEQLPVVRDADRIPSFLTRRVTMRLIESFRGVASQTTIDVRTGTGGGDCGFGFEHGRTYLVYASNTREGLATSICSRTRATEDAREDLDYLRNIGRTPSATGVIRGTVRRFDPDPASGGTMETPSSGIRIVIAGNGVRQEMRSKADGTFEVRLPTGEYSLSIDVPSGFYSWKPPPVVLRDVRGCAEVTVLIRADGRITGRVIGADGSPLAGLQVRLLRPLWYDVPGKPPRDPYLSEVSEATQTNADGSYEFRRVAPGNYLIGVDSRTPATAPGRRSWVLLPGTVTVRDARTVVVGVSEQVEVEELVMPPSR
jgi:hypothetical protein